jgi:hypothetical protein
MDTSVEPTTFLAVVLLHPVQKIEGMSSLHLIRQPSGGTTNKQTMSVGTAYVAFSQK